MAPSPRGLTLALALALAATPAALLAPRTGWSQIDEIVVTTRKREENLQDVPIAINAISADEIQRKQINSVGDIMKNLSSVEFDEGTSKSDTRITVRGLSPTRGRQNVAVLVDGIDVSTEAISNSGGGLLLNNRLVDVERIEVVKGPQLALYGRSAFAGAVQWVTKDPSDEFEATVGVDANNEDQYSGSLSLSGPVFGEKLGLRFNAAVWDEPGFYKNTITGDSLGDDEGYGLALTAKSQVTDSFSLKFRAEYQDQQTGPSPTQFLKFNAEVPLPAESLISQTIDGKTFPPIYRCFSQLANATWNEAFAARNARIYAPGFIPGGPDTTTTAPYNQDFPNDLYSSPYCETAVPTYLGAAKGFDKNQIAVSPNPFTDKDYEGTDRQLMRFSLVGEWELAKGTLTSRTGYIHEEAFEAADNGKFAFVPDSFSPLTGAPYSNGSVNTFLLTTDKLTTQFSQELMFRTTFDGPAQVSIGGLFWKENVGNDSDSLTIQASGSHCAWGSIAGIPFDDLFPTVEPGTGCYGYTERAAAPLIRGGFDFTDGTPYNGIAPYKKSSPADRNTEHRSIFGMLELEVTDAVKFTFEGRYNVETVDVVGPVFYDPEASGGPGSWNVCGIFFRPCSDAWLFGPTGPFFSQANFESWYDTWSPNALIDDRAEPGDPDYQVRYRDRVDPQCQNDPGLLARLKNVDDGGTDPFDLFNPYCVRTISRDDKWFAPKLTLDWRVNDDVRTYISWAKAEKPGGFSTLSIGSSGLNNRELLEFEPETLDVYEFGWKSQLLDRTLVFNGAIFYQDFSGKQTLVSVLNAAGDRIVNRLVNADGASVLGTEVDLAWAPETTFLGGNWVLKGSYTWLKAEYGSKTVVPNNSFTFIAGAGNCEPIVVTALNGQESMICNVSLDGKKLEDAPEGKFVGQIQYRKPVGAALDLVAEADFNWTAKRYIEATNENWVEADTNLNIRIGFEGDRWDVIGYVNNVFDDDTIVSVLGGPSLACCFVLGSGIDLTDVEPPAANPANNEPGKTVTVELPAFRAAFAPDPRVIGIQARYRFGAAVR
jgi:outer membrane receptor protein involved in Fe transport